jgi:hypothetical protein
MKSATDQQARALAARLVRDVMALPGTIEDLQRAVVFIQLRDRLIATVV